MKLRIARFHPVSCERALSFQVIEEQAVVAMFPIAQIIVLIDRILVFTAVRYPIKVIGNEPSRNQLHTVGENMSSLPQPATTPRFIPKSMASEIREGDWNAYRRHSKFCSRTDFVTSNDSLTVFRRQCALAYLGKRAQLYGGACSKTQHRTFTPGFLVEIGKANENRRFIRYPWLEKLLDLVAEIEREQAKVPDADNVISLVSIAK